MKKDILKAQIIDTLDVIIEQTQIIVQHRGEIPQIEIDLAKKNILELYQNFHFLDKMNNVNISKTIKEMASEETEETKETTEEFEETIEKPIETIENEVFEEEKETPTAKEIEKTPEKITEIQKIEEPSIEKEEEEVAEPVVEEVIEETQTTEEIIPEQKPLETKKEIKADDYAPNLFDELEESKPIKTEKTKTSQEPKNQTNIPNSQATIADKFKTEKKSIHDTIERNDDKSIASKLQKAPIQDLVKAIGLNDRFFLTKELFKNNSEQYNQSIQVLNEMPGLDEAFDYLDDLKTKLEWDESSSACLKIYDLIRRKHQNKK